MFPLVKTMVDRSVYPLPGGGASIGMPALAAMAGVAAGGPAGGVNPNFAALASIAARAQVGVAKLPLPHLPAGLPFPCAPRARRIRS